MEYRLQRRRPRRNRVELEAGDWADAAMEGNTVPTLTSCIAIVRNGEEGGYFFFNRSFCFLCTA